MKHLLALVSCVALAAGCKTDSSEQPAASSAAPSANDSSRPPRSGKIDLPQRRNPSGSAEADVPALPDEDRRDEWRGRREDRRKERQEMLDTNKDGTISPEEMAAARKVRAEDMRTRLDTDGDGKVTVAELGESRMSRRLGDVTALDVDKNGDISAAEIEASMEKMRERMRALRGSGDGSGGPDGERRGRRGWGGDDSGSAE